MASRTTIPYSNDNIDVQGSEDSVSAGYDLRSRSSAPPQSKANPTADELIIALANAYENKRARQTIEWERMARQKLSFLN